MKKVLVCGAGGFIGGHLVTALKGEGYWVRGVDIKRHDFAQPPTDEFILGDLRDPNVVREVVSGIEMVYQLAADMGGAGYIFTEDHDAAVMHNSATINLNVLEFGSQVGVKCFFYSSSACIYPGYNQMDPDNPKCSEDSVYPAEPDSEYGWEKLFSERLYAAYQKNYGLEIHVARFHNILGPQGAWCNGREKAPAAICRKVAQTPDDGEMEMWGDGKQTRHSELGLGLSQRKIQKLIAKSRITDLRNGGQHSYVSARRLFWVIRELQAVANGESTHAPHQ